MSSACFHSSFSIPISIFHWVNCARRNFDSILILFSLSVSIHFLFLLVVFSSIHYILIEPVTKCAAIAHEPLSHTQTYTRIQSLSKRSTASASFRFLIHWNYLKQKP